jgi:hypothetical protein
MSSIIPGDHPKTFAELFAFYNSFVKLLYSEVQAHNRLPLEVLFEINAAFDHLSEHWTLDRTEKEAVGEAFSHLKRSCLDLFKIKYSTTKDQYDELRKIDTSIVDNGNYERQLLIFFNELRKEAIQARKRENETHDGDITQVFERWVGVYLKCLKFENDFYLHPGLKWSKRKGIAKFFRQNIFGFLIGVLSTLLALPIWNFLKDLLEWIKRVLNI